MRKDFQHLTDEALFQLYRKGEVAAFDLFYERLSPRIWGFLRKRTVSQALAEDLYQEVWSKIHRSKEQYDHKFPVAPWIFTIARSVLYDGLRGIQRNNEVAVGEESLSRASDLTSFEESTKLDSPDLEVALAALSPEQKEIIKLRYQKEWSFGEIASSLGLSEDSVRKRISRILKELRGRWV